jgi:hypothetical protein
LLLHASSYVDCLWSQDAGALVGLTIGGWSYDPHRGQAASGRTGRGTRREELARATDLLDLSDQTDLGTGTVRIRTVPVPRSGSGVWSMSLN